MEDKTGVSNAKFEQVLVLRRCRDLFQKRNAIAVGNTPKYIIQRKGLNPRGKVSLKNGIIIHKNKQLLDISEIEI